MVQGRKTIDPRGEKKAMFGFTILPSIHHDFKEYCSDHRLSMSETIEDLMIRLMDEDNDVISLARQKAELERHLDLVTYKYERDRIEMESLQADVATITQRMNTIRMDANKDRYKTYLEENHPDLIKD